MEVPPLQASVEDRMNASAAALGLLACRNFYPSMPLSWVAPLYSDKHSVDKYIMPREACKGIFLSQSHLEIKFSKGF